MPELAETALAAASLQKSTESGDMHATHDVADAMDAASDWQVRCAWWPEKF